MHLHTFCAVQIPLAIGVFLGIMGGAILQKWHFFSSFWVVLGTQSVNFETNFETNLKLIRFFRHPKRHFCLSSDHRLNGYR